MEKEKKGLFGRLLDFWKEKIGIGETDSIGFWHEKRTVENHFAEMGAVAALSQQEMKKAFWEEATETVFKQEEMENSVLGKRKEAVIEGKEDSASEMQEETERAENRRTTRLFTAELFQEEKQAEAEKEGMGRTFFLEKPVEETERRKIIPVTAETAQEKKVVLEGPQEMEKREEPQRKEVQAELVVDIEKLMRQMTKKLWEERESCGRRLR